MRRLSYYDKKDIELASRALWLSYDIQIHGGHDNARDLVIAAARSILAETFGIAMATAVVDLALIEGKIRPGHLIRSIRDLWESGEPDVRIRR